MAQPSRRALPPRSAAVPPVLPSIGGSPALTRPAVSGCLCRLRPPRRAWPRSGSASSLPLPRWAGVGLLLLPLGLVGCRSLAATLTRVEAPQGRCCWGGRSSPLPAEGEAHSIATVPSLSAAAFRFCPVAAGGRAEAGGGCRAQGAGRCDQAGGACREAGGRFWQDTSVDFAEEQHGCTGWRQQTGEGCTCGAPGPPADLLPHLSFTPALRSWRHWWRRARRRRCWPPLRALWSPRRRRRSARAACCRATRSRPSSARRARYACCARYPCCAVLGDHWHQPCRRTHGAPHQLCTPLRPAPMPMPAGATC